MGKQVSKYVCQQCGYESPRWLGKCTNCGEWNSLVETAVSVGSQNSGLKTQNYNSKPRNLKEIRIAKNSRVSTKISELDRVLGGGLVPGQVVLLAGEPGIGKSTILLQVAQNISRSKQKFLYISGEESANQIKIRAERMGVKGASIELMESTNVDEVVETVEQLNCRTGQPKSNGSPVNRLTGLSGIVIDSIQTMQTSDLSGMAGSVGQIRECAYRLVKVAKSTGTPIVIVGHVTKEGAVAGPAVLAHTVDTVLWFEGDKSLTLRMLHSHKNRFGPTDEVGIFEMEERGLVSLSNPEKLFLSGDHNAAGLVTTCIMHGTRPILAEIQTLVTPTKMAYPKRIAQGFDTKRLEIIIAILSRRTGVPLMDMDVFLNVSGGFNVREPGADFAVALSLASSYFDKKLPARLVALGELSLTGDVRAVSAQEKRIKEAKRLGYKHTISNKDFKYLSLAISKYLR